MGPFWKINVNSLFNYFSKKRGSALTKDVKTIIKKINLIPNEVRERICKMFFSR
jgi:hypothetical protein